MSPPPARYGVIGHPVGHSRSPWIHARFAAQTGQHLRYDAIDSPPDAFAATVEHLRAQGLAGANVTVPFKLQASELAQQRSARVQLAQAANTLLWRDDGSLYADNTDGLGLVADITGNAATPLVDQHLLILGAGGAAAGVLGALVQQRPASITLANRSDDKARALLHRHAQWAQQHGVALHLARLGDALGGINEIPLETIGESTYTPLQYHIIINATSSSLGGQALPLPLARCAAGALVLDMMYGAAAQDFLQPLAAAGAAAHGITLRDGLGMLVEQAAQSFALWRGVLPDTAPVLRALRARVDAANSAA